jgi:hypothetical protein
MVMTKEEKKERRKAVRDKPENKAKNKARGKAYYEENKEEIKANYEKNKEKLKLKAKVYNEKNKEKIKEYNQRPERTKSQKISSWKKGKIISDDWNATYEWFMNTKNCQKCKIEFVSGKGKHLDHNHAITDGPNTRAVLCMPCNIHEGKKRHASKEECDKHYKENIKCVCGSFISRGNYTHKKTAKHINFHKNL